MSEQQVINFVAESGMYLPPIALVIAWFWIKTSHDRKMKRQTKMPGAGSDSSPEAK